ncbi:MAG: aldose 1-epimerase family protein [Agitococcus sp.]
MYLLQNSLLSIAIDALGAELKSVKRGDMEYMWRADPQFWGRTSPILFPIVGRLTNNRTQIAGKSYQLPQHGFARDQPFNCILQHDNQLIFSLSSNDKTKENYPFDFKLDVIYTLENNSIIVEWRVFNLNQEVMPFSIGAHPAFSTQLHANDQFEDYDIIFDKQQQYYVWQLNQTMQLVEKNVPFSEALEQFRLDYRYFEIDALVFPHQQLNTITLQNRHHGHGVSVDFTGFPEVALWTADSKHKRSPFICIEPWFGHADLENGAPDLMRKRGIIHLAAGQIFSAQYRMDFF